jgi:hypothetical protein
VLSRKPQQRSIIGSRECEHNFDFSQEKVDLGELMLSLCYLPTAGRLTLTVIKARNLKAMDITGKSGA